MSAAHINDLEAQCIFKIFREAYNAWIGSFSAGYMPFIKQAVRAWSDIKGWLATHHPAILDSLRPGASEQDIEEAENQIGRKFPHALRVLYRLHDGQGLQFDRNYDSPTDVHIDASLFHGLFGGYAFYDHFVSVRMLPLARVVRYTAEFYNNGLLEVHNQVIFAASYNFRKVFCVDLEDASIHVNSPISLIKAAPASKEGASDGVLQWLAEYGCRLANGYYEVSEMDPRFPASRCICLFPLQPPVMATQVTHGVQVRATSLYVPEMSREHLFTYSIRFSLLPPDQQLQHWPATAGVPHVLTSCQLLNRHWIIRDAQGDIIDEVRGEAVVGKYPLLKPGEPEFIYQSCTYQRDQDTGKGSMEGSFMFVEGSIRQRTGPEFEVFCPRFSLEIPDYIY